MLSRRCGRAVDVSRPNFELPHQNIAGYRPDQFDRTGGSRADKISMALQEPRRDSMRRRRVLKLVLVPALGCIFFVISLTCRQHDLRLNAALDNALKGFLQHLPPTTSSARKIRGALESTEPSKSPRDFQVPEKYSSSHVAKACTFLRTKRILLVGPETTFYLHSLWLRALETHDHKLHECPGPEYCNFHHICLSPGYATPQGRYKLPPKNRELIASNSAVLRYVLSTSLYTAQYENDTGYTKAVVDPATGVRLKNAYWLYQARKADVILINRGPIPAPAWTFASHNALGNWTFARELPRHLGEGKSLGIEVVNAAFHVTVTRFIPEVLESLHTAQADPLIRAKTLIWPASWFAGWADFGNFHSTRKVDDPWALYYNAQGKPMVDLFGRF